MNSFEAEGGLDDVRLVFGDRSAFRRSGVKILLSRSSRAFVFNTFFLSSICCSIEPRTNSLKSYENIIIIYAKISLDITKFLYLYRVSQKKVPAFKNLYHQEYIADLNDSDSS